MGKSCIFKMITLLRLNLGVVLLVVSNRYSFGISCASPLAKSSVVCLLIMYLCILVVNLYYNILIKIDAT